MRERVFVLLLSAALLTGCGGKTTPRSAPEETPSQEEGSLTAAQTEDMARELTEEEIIAAYYRAETAWGWFDLKPMPDTGESVRVNGAAYRRVDSPSITKTEDLRTYLRSLFSQELTESLLSSGGETPYYRDVDGALYVCFRGRARKTGLGEALIQVEKTGDTSYQVDVTVELLSEGEEESGIACWSFP